MKKKQSLSRYKYTEDINSFYLQHAAVLLNRTPRTIRRWLKESKIQAHQSPINRWWYFQLEEINKIRRLDGQETLTKEEAVAILVDHYREEEGLEL